MARKVVLISDTGIDSVFAITVALLSKELEVVGLAASAGNVSAAQATRNIQIIVEQIDPPRRPRLGEALDVIYAIQATDLHGSNGLGGVDFPVAQLHHLPSSDKLIGDLARLYPKELSVIVLGPATVLARALDRDPEVRNLLDRVILVGGVWREPGDFGPCSEFHFACDPHAAQHILQSGLNLSLLPLDITRQLIFSPGDILHLPEPHYPAGSLLRRILPPGIHASSNLFGTEGFYLLDVVGIVALASPGLVQYHPIACAIETRGDLTHGMSVFDTRWNTKVKSNVDIAYQMDVGGVRRYIREVLDSDYGKIE